MNILITSVGRRNYIVDYFKDALKGRGNIIVSNSIENTSGMYVGDKSYLSPNIKSKEYIPFLLEICRKEDIKVIIPLFDMDLSAISFNKKLFLDNGIVPIVANYSTINQCFDKLSYPDLLKQIGINTPRTFLTLDEVEELLISKKIVFPLMLKPRWGTGSIATAIVYTSEELSHNYNKLKFDLSNTYLDSPVPEGVNNTIIIQEFITGIEYGMDVINDLDGKYITSWVKKKLGMRSGETDGAITVKEVNIEFVGERLGTLLKHPALLDVDLIVNENGEIFVIDLNPRFGGGYPFSHVAGVNLPLAILKWINHQKVYDELDISYNITSAKGITILKKR